jgi:formylglycine-generating enzyme required for sulfatase activity
MSQRKPAIFLSYTRFDDTYEDGALSTLRERLEKALRFSSGEPLDIFQDVEDIKHGQNLHQRIEESLDEAMVFVPIITPSYLKSKWCRKEFERFLRREQQLGRGDLILPIYYQRVLTLERARQGPQAASAAPDALVRELAPRLSVDWRDLRRKGLESQEIRMAVESIAERILEVLEELEQAPPPAPPRVTPPSPPPSSPPRVTAPSPEPSSPPRVTRPDPIVKLPGGATLELIEIPEGPFLMGSSDDDPDARDHEKPQHQLYLPTYSIGKTPVTNAQFRPFVKGDGYRNRAYWSDAGWQWRTIEKRTQPYYWNDKKWNGAAQPVVGITWYEAAAYCRWLSAQTGDNYCLPSEAEWEKAARGTDGRSYPWGNEAPDETRANFGRIVGRTTPVGSYSAGASPYGALDMAGNVWEWTRSEFQKYPYDPEDGREEGSDPAGKRFTLRGGSWFFDRTSVRCGSRDWYLPDSGYNNLGFRVLQSLRSSD